ncbi:putative cysteine-rich repeat secretory protein 5 [Bienertia sinuspersici]
MLTDLISQENLSLFNNATFGEEINQTYGLFMCRGDLNATQCYDCVVEATKTIFDKCPTQKEALVWFNECMIRYSNRNIFSLYEEAPMVYSWSSINVSNPQVFGEVYATTVDGLIMEAAYDTSSGGYAAGEANVTEFESVYVLAQCTPDIVGSRCERCLRVALRNMGGCCGTARTFLAMYMPSCWLRYDQLPIVAGKPPNAPFVLWITCRPLSRIIRPHRQCHLH